MRRLDHLALALLLALFAVDDWMTGRPVHAAISTAFVLLNVAAAIWRRP